MTGCDLPVDSHKLIALCAPRPMFLSYGIPEKGDANWLDHRGSYMAMIAAGTAYKLLGVKDLGDDGLNIDLNHVIPALDSVGLKGTFYISDYFKGLNAQINGWRKAAAEGHELANHTILHGCEGGRREGNL